MFCVFCRILLRENRDPLHKHPAEENKSIAFDISQFVTSGGFDDFCEQMRPFMDNYGADVFDSFSL